MTLRAEPSADDIPERPRVLLVDDDEVNLLLTSVALQDQGFAVTEAASGEAAIRVLADWLPDIVVLDAVMPGLDGFETCRELRVLPGFESLPVLMLTGLDDDASITRAYEAGATDFFVKSTQWSLLAGRLRYLLRASRTRVELERSKSRLARAQDLARMGSFDWRRGQDGPVFSIEGPARVRLRAGRPARLSQPPAHGSRGGAQGLPRADAQRDGPQHGARDRHSRAPGRRPPADRPHRGRARVQRARQPGRLHRHRPGRDRPAPRRGPDPPPRQLRHPDRAAEPAPADLARRARARPRPPPRPRGRAAADRPRPLQDHQRHARPRRRRRAADGGLAAAALVRAPFRPGARELARERRRSLAPHARGGRPARRRRVRRAAARGRRRGRRRARRDAHPRGDAKADLDRPAGVLRHRQRRHRDLPARRRHRRRPAAQLRHRDVLGQVGRAQLVVALPAATSPARAARSSSSRARCTRRSSATSWCCTTSRRSTCAARA